MNKILIIEKTDVDIIEGVDSVTGDDCKIIVCKPSDKTLILNIHKDTVFDAIRQLKLESNEEFNKLIQLLYNTNYLDEFKKLILKCDETNKKITKKEHECNSYQDIKHEINKLWEAIDALNERIDKLNRVKK